MTLRYSNEDDIPGIKSLMQLVFGDSEQYMDLFFRLRYQNNALLFEHQGKIVSSAFLLDGMLRYKHQLLSATYLYACATAHQYRGQGLMAAIIEKAYEDKCKQGNIGLLLLPAEESLYAYYEKLGFRNFFYNQTTAYSLFDHIPQPQVLAYQLQTVSCQEYAQLRKLFLTSDFSVHYPDAHFQLIEQDGERKGRFYKLLESGRVVGIAYIMKECYKLFVKELLGDNIDIGRLQQLLFASFDTHLINITTPGKQTKTAMMRFCKGYQHEQNQQGYFSWGLE